jgi:hypothetical protein
MIKQYLTLSNLTLFVALALSTVAEYYSIIGLTAIFAGAFVPVVIMGVTLGIAKIVTTVWLRKYWNQAGTVIKVYLVSAVVVLAFLTSMGIFGFLSKAHIEQGMPTGDIAAKVSLIDEKIKVQRDNIEVARSSLSQMDAQVNARLDRGGTEQGAERAVQIRRQQVGERTKLQKEISLAQAEIAKLNEERSPIASELRKVEAEVGPIKYIASMIYGDSADNNALEAAVRWVIIILVLVFDPLAICLVLAGNQSKEWDKQAAEAIKTEVAVETPIEKVVEELSTTEYKPDIVPLTAEQIQQILESAQVIEEPIAKDNIEESITIKKIVIDPHPIGWMYSPAVIASDKEPAEIQVIVETVPERIPFDIDSITVDSTAPISKVVETGGVTNQIVRSGDYVEVDGKQLHSRVAEGMYPDLLALKPDDGKEVAVNFGTNFPKYAQRGDIFTRVDILPNRVYKFDGNRWLDVIKSNSDSYLSQPKYIEFLVDKISTGEYDLYSLTDPEQEAVEDYLRTNQKS